MKKEKESRSKMETGWENRIDLKGDNKIIIQDSEHKNSEEENIIDVEGSYNIIIQNSGSSNININRKKD